MSGARRGLFYLFAESNFSVVIQLIGAAVVSRLLSPEQNGTFQVAAALAAIASTFRDFGAAEYLIQKKEVNQDDFRKVFAVNLITSWSMCILLVIASGFVASFYGNADLEKILWILSVNFLLIPFGAVTMAWHRRNMNFEPVFWSGIISNVVTFLICIVCAFNGFGPYSLAWSSLAGVAATVLVALYFRVPGFTHFPRFSGLSEVLNFGKHVVGIYVIGQLGKSAPELIIGRMLSLSSVAFYSRGGSLLEIFSRLVTRVVAPVCLPYFSTALRDDGKLSVPYLRAVSYMTYIGWPFLFFTGFYSEEIIRVLYGTQWSEATLIAKLICVAGAIDVIHVYSKEALIAVGRPDRGNWLQWATQIVRVIAVVVGTIYGLFGVGVGLIAAAAIGAMLAQRELHKHAEILGTAVWAALRPAVIVSAVVALLTVALHYAMTAFFTPLVTLFVVGIMFTLQWLVMVRLQHHPIEGDVAALLARARGDKS